MILYHGSNVEIDEIHLSKGRHGKDFGKGFYLSADYLSRSLNSMKLLLTVSVLNVLRDTRKIGRSSYWPTE